VAVLPCIIIKHARFYECQNVYYVFECIHRAPRLLNLVDVTDNTPNRSWHRLFCLSYSDRSSSFYRWKRRYIAAECSTRFRCDPWQVRWFSAPAAYEFFLDSMVLQHLDTNDVQLLTSLFSQNIVQCRPTNWVRHRWGCIALQKLIPNLKHFVLPN